MVRRFWCEQESRLEPALFFSRRDGRLDGILVSHVDDLEGGLRQGCLDQGIGFEKSGQRLGLPPTTIVSSFFVVARSSRLRATRRNDALSVLLLTTLCSRRGLAGAKMKDRRTSMRLRLLHAPRWDSWLPPSV